MKNNVSEVERERSGIAVKVKVCTEHGECAKMTLNFPAAPLVSQGKRHVPWHLYSRKTSSRLAIPASFECIFLYHTPSPSPHLTPPLICLHPILFNNGTAATAFGDGQSVFSRALAQSPSSTCHGGYARPSHLRRSSCSCQKGARNLLARGSHASASSQQAAGRMRHHLD